jgi:hypothetical protein
LPKQQFKYIKGFRSKVVIQEGEERGRGREEQKRRDVIGAQKYPRSIDNVRYTHGAF